ncbi:bifunctional pyr operon transcriptional regulator/uracil phosphoribosyltransferase PyrR [Candidatus Sumerlaeota bacterium]|nr:bifunctional pyr operon transcriptional regulator/uracil phosphoribosyltransferase PyrR [Candidatus Sumerlaeota bacterium]
MTTLLLDTPQLEAKIGELADALAALAGEPDTCALVGIRTRGVILAQRIQKYLMAKRGWEFPLGIVDITLYRDDLSQLALHPLVRGTEIAFDIEGKTIFLIDDVLYTGRTIRSAIDEIIDFGRPRAIRLGVLVDRGLREYPIQADCAALTVRTTPEEQIKVHFIEKDGVDEVILTRRGG